MFTQIRHIMTGLFRASSREKRPGTSPRGCAAGLCLAGLLALPAAARADARMEWRGRDSLYLRFELTAGEVVLKPDYRLTALPALVSAAGDTLRLPLDTVEFAGRRNRKYNDRAAALNHRPRRETILTPRDTLRVDTLLRVEPWMRDTTLSLCIGRLLDGCCTIDTLDRLCVAQTRYLPEPVAVVPVVPDNAAEQLVQEGEVLLEPISDYRPVDLNVLLPAGAAYVRFEQDEYTIDPDLGGNRRALERVAAIVRRMEGDTASRIVRVVIVGTASPDGPLRKNIGLASRRADALADYIAQHLDTTGVVLERVNAGEGWGNLTALLRNLPDERLPERDELLHIIETTARADGREHLLRTYKGGRPFRRLLDMFDMQRTASAVRLYYEAESDTAATIINDAMRLIQHGSYQVAVDLLEPLDDDRRYNTLGTAYYMVGRRDEAMQCFERAATLGDTEAKDNLRQLILNNEELKRMNSEQQTISRQQPITDN